MVKSSLTTPKKILVGLSGGVDSAVAAALLLEQWYEVVAGFMKNYADETNPTCHTREDRDEALRVAHHLWIKTFIIFDFRKEYNERIIQYIYDGYQQGLTPNPDVLCNSLIKFDLFLNEAVRLWCDGVATGHYARIQQSWNKYQLLKWKDTNKDQSYFLSWLTQEQLSRAVFPLGWFTKPEVRQKARELNLPNAERKDSQGLCFIGKIPIKEFLGKTIPTQAWPIKDTSWKILWTHPWALFYTIGQREWLWLSGGPWFVVEKNVKTNELIVWHEDDPRLWTSTALVNDRHWSSSVYALPMEGKAKLRYRQPDQGCVMDQNGKGETILQFSKPQKAVTPGQIAVLYKNDLLIWQGIIASTPSSTPW